MEDYFGVALLFVYGYFVLRRDGHELYLWFVSTDLDHSPMLPVLRSGCEEGTSCFHEAKVVSCRKKGDHVLLH